MKTAVRIGSLTHTMLKFGWSIACSKRIRALNTSRLVARNMRQAGHVGQAVLDVQVGPADAARARLDEDFVGREHRVWHLLDREWLLAYADGGSCH